MNPRELWEILRQAGKEFVDDDALRLAAALAYYAAFSLAPLLLIAIAVAGFFFGDDLVRGELDDELRSHLGAGTAYVVQDMIAHARRSGQGMLMSITGLGMLLLGAGGLFAQLQDALNTVWGVRTKTGKGIKGMLGARLKSFSLVLGTGFLLLSSMILSATLSATADYLGSVAGLPHSIWQAVNGLASLGITTVLFAAIFKVLPDARIAWRHVMPGALFTALLFAAGKSLMAWYLGRQFMSSAYGSAGSLAVLLLWLHYSSVILLLGAEFTQVWTNRRGGSIGPSMDEGE